MSKVCDKDRDFFGNIAMSSSTNTARGKDQEQFKPKKKHDEVRQNKEELDKINRI